MNWKAVRNVLVITFLCSLAASAIAEQGDDDKKNPFSTFVVPGNAANYQKFHETKVSAISFEMTFEAKAENDIHIGFFPEKKARSSTGYEIVLGGWGNTNSVIRWGTQANALTQRHGAVADRKNFKPFWVSLHNNILKVGRGHVFGADEIMSAQVPRVTGAADLYVGFGGWDKEVTFKYYGPSLSCVHSDVPDFDPTPAPTRVPPATPTPCEVGEWENSNKAVEPVCSTRCGGGIATQTRKVIKQATNGGSACPALIRTIPCNEKPCPVNCEVSSWSEWSDCSKKCDDGTGAGEQKQTRTVKRQEAFGGIPCPSTLTQTRKCNTHGCPFDCKVSEWSNWSPCSVTCGSGVKTRTRTVEAHAKNGGKQCPLLVESQTCKDRDCPVQCQVSEWSKWSECSKSCGGGVRTSTRSILRQGDGCPKDSELIKTETCGAQFCPIDCKVSAWEPVGKCSTRCGGGIQKYIRSVVVQPAFGGKACPVLETHENCNTQQCPPVCKVGSWSEWSECSKECGSGVQTQTRKRTYTRPVKIANEAELMELSSQAKEYADDEHEVAGMYNDDLKITIKGREVTITKGILTFGNGRVVDDKTIAFGHGLITVSAHLNGCDLAFTPAILGTWHKKDCDVNCPRNEMQSRPCNTQACPIDCKVSHWGAWSTCSSQCGGGRHERQRSIVVAPAHGGLACPNLVETEECNTHVCPCKLSDWTEWSKCSESCGTGSQSRTRTIISHSALCAGVAVNEKRPCNTHSCPVDCKVSEFTEWGACSTRCGGGVQTRSRYVQTPAAFGGQHCPNLSDTRRCNEQPCPVNCKVSEWSDWSKCSQSCGGGVQTQRREVQVSSANGGEACPSTLTQSRPCNEHSCPIDCVMSSWSEWSSCSAPCNTGSQKSYRTVLRAPSHGGMPCGPTERTQPCNTHMCIDCKTSDWSAWSECSKKCGGGVRESTIKILHENGNGGKSCPAVTKRTEKCNEHACPIDCEVGPWSEFSECSTRCGGGQRKANREVITPAQFGGKACPAREKVEACNTQACPERCMVTEWSAWSTCSKTCGGGKRVATRTIRDMAATNLGVGVTLANDEAAVSSGWIDSADNYLSIQKGLTIASYNSQGKIEYVNDDLKGDQSNILKYLKAFGTSDSMIVAIQGGGAQNMDQSLRSLLLRHGCTKPSGADAHTAALCIRSQGHIVIDRAITGDSGSISWSGTYLIASATDFLGASECPTTAHKEEVCNIQACPVDCVVSEWSNFGTCSTVCGGGIQKQSRSILVAPAHGGKSCPDLEHTQPCNTHKCPIDCKVSDWSAWSGCSTQCGPGVQSRTRTIKMTDSDGGAKCPSNLREERTCTVVPLSVCEKKPVPPPATCSNDYATFSVDSNFANYNRFDTAKVNAMDFQLKFNAQGCNDIHVAFLPEQSARMASNSYEVVIGGWGNTQSVIRFGTQAAPLATARHSPAHCNQLRPFWIVLKNDVMSVGTGSIVGENVFMSAKVPRINARRCDCLFVAYGAWDKPVTFQTGGPTVRCGDKCPAAIAPTAAPEVVDFTDSRKHCVDHFMAAKYDGQGKVFIAGAEPSARVHDNRNDCRGVPQGWAQVASFGTAGVKAIHIELKGVDGSTTCTATLDISGNVATEKVFTNCFWGGGGSQFPTISTKVSVTRAASALLEVAEEVAEEVTREL